MILPQVSELLAADLSKKPDSWFLSDEGRQSLEHILSWQSDHGDWPKNTDTTTKVFSGDREKLRGTFDNGATTGELRALERAFTLTGDARYEKAFLKGFDHILQAQYANGGWPQYFPLRKGYYTHITFNDNCMVRLLEFLNSAITADEFSFLDGNRRDKATKAIERGIDCIVKCQVVIKGTPTVWCAQHDAVTLAPAIARSYELASLSGSESAGILKYLMSLPKPTPEVIRAVKAGVAWFESAKINGVKIEKVNGDRKVTKDESAPPVWARFYELETNRPFFCDRDGVPKYNLEEIGSERRNGYAWYGNWGDSLANAYAKWPHR
jgi:pectate lyase